MLNPNVKILHIEDDDGHALLLKLNLEEIGFKNELIRFTNGDEFFEYLLDNFTSKNTYIVLLDIRLPKYDGITILKLIKQNKKYRNFKIIMVSTSDNPVEIKETIKCGANCYYTKPVNYEELLAKIEKIAEN